jgi:Tol biopolymer transport system component
MDGGTWTRLPAALLLCLTGLSGCSSTSSSESEEPTTPPQEATTDTPAAAGPDRIAFVRFRVDVPDVPKLWTANSDGSDPAAVGGQAAWFPDWSPDRTQLIFGFTDQNGDDQIATIRPDGRDLTLLTDGAGYNEAPDYSPDGQSVIYGHSDVHDDDPDFATSLWLMNADGSGRHPLQLSDGGGDDTEPEFSPDGKRIVFQRYRDDNADITAIYVAAADGSGVRRLTPWQHKVEHPRWSRDGRTIIYNIENDKDKPSNQGEGIWTVAAAGGEPELLLASTDEMHAYKPDYSLDGQRIVFGCGLDRRTSENICVMNADGTGAKALFDGAEWENHVVWD